MSDSSPPSEALEVRGKTLTPESPKPVHFPLPSNVPILEKQMEPAFEARAASGALLGAPAVAVNDANTNGLASAELSEATKEVRETAQNGVRSKADNGHSEPIEAASTEAHQTIFPNSVVPQPTQYPEASQGDPASASGGAPSVLDPFLNPTLNTPATEQKYGPSPNSVSETNQANAPTDATAPNRDANTASVDFQTLLAQLSHTPTNIPQPEVGKDAATPMIAAPFESTQTILSPSSTTLLANPNLPPRPPPQEKPATHPNYRPTDDIRSYHPHSQQNPAASYQAQHPPQMLNTNAPGLSPPVPTFQQTPTSAYPPAQSPITPSSYRQRDSLEPRPDSAGEDKQWPPELERLYAQFLRDESANVAEGRWEKFPQGSRLFVGNLPSEKVHKRDLFERFYQYGKLAQISIKQAFGFVQFLDADACYRALNGEQGVAVAGRKMHLEVSKPQRNTNKGSNRDDGRRRSRSPDYNRRGSRGVDRYSSGGQVGSPRDQNFRRGRDDYRPGRSPSPDRYGRSRDRYDRRRRSPSPRPIPGSQYNSDDRLAQQMGGSGQRPDVEILCVSPELSSYISAVDAIFRNSGLHTHTTFVESTYSEERIVKRVIEDGVKAIVRPTREEWQTQTVSFKIFFRDSGGSNVRFDEYKLVRTDIAAQLILQAKNSSNRPPAYSAPPTAYGMPPLTYGYPPPPTPPTAVPPTLPHIPPPNVGQFPPSVDPNMRNQLLAGMPLQAGGQTGQAAISPDITRLLSQLSQQAGTTNPSAPPAAVAPTWAQQPPAIQNQSRGGPVNPAYNFQASNTNSMTPAATTQPRPASQQQVTPQQPDMTEMLAQLAQYSR